MIDPAQSIGESFFLFSFPPYTLPSAYPSPLSVLHSFLFPFSPLPSLPFHPLWFSTIITIKLAKINRHSSWTSTSYRSNSYYMPTCWLNCNRILYLAIRKIMIDYFHCLRHNIVQHTIILHSFALRLWHNYWACACQQRAKHLRRTRLSCCQCEYNWRRTYRAY